MTDFKIRLCTLENNCFDDISSISKNTLEKVQEDITNITLYNSHFLVYIHFQINLIEFDSLRKKISKIPIVKLNMNKISTTRDHLKYNSITINLLSSFRFYLDNAEKHIIRAFGKDSPELVNFKSELSSYFDNYFSYRFLYKLRDYALHVGFPIEMIHFEAKENITKPETMVGNLRLLVSKESLLAEKKYLGKPVTNDLIKIVDDIDIIPLVTQLGALLLKLEKHIYSLHHEKLECAISNLKQFAGKYKTIKNDIVIIVDMKEEGNYINFNMITLPFVEINDIERFSKWPK